MFCAIFNFQTRSSLSSGIFSNNSNASSLIAVIMFLSPFYDRTCPFPYTTNLSEVSASSPIGPLA